MVLDAVTSPFCLLFSSLTTITCRTPSPPSRNIKRHDGVSTIWGLTSLYNVRRNTSECRTRATKTGHTHTKTLIYPAVSSNELVIFHLFAYKFRNSLGKKRGGIWKSRNVSSSSVLINLIDSAILKQNKNWKKRSCFTKLERRTTTAIWRYNEGGKMIQIARHERYNKGRTTSKLFRFVSKLNKQTNAPVPPAQNTSHTQ